MRYGEGLLEEILRRTDLVQLVGRRVKLERRGRVFWGLCPFHKEKSPSFKVENERRNYKCFGCGAGGDAFRWLMETEGLPFREAIERLAGEAGVELPKWSHEDEAREQKRKSLYDIVDAAALFFEEQLRAGGGAAARAYLISRGLDDVAVRRFRLGYAPGGNSQLIAHLRGRNIPLEDIVAAGLARPAEDGRPARDFFFNRVMFPIADVRGRTIAFGARALDPDAKPKYINTGETALFSKGRLLYNFGPARTAALQSGTLIVAEGYMDVIALVRAGFEGAVAPLGTALTSDQLQLLWQVVPEPILSFDGDEAGLRAADRAAKLALPELRPGHSLRFVFLPHGEDPDSFLRSFGPAAMHKLADAAEPLAQVLWRRLTDGRDFSTPERRAGLESQLSELASLIRDQKVAGYYRREFDSRVFAAFKRRAQSPGGTATKSRFPRPAAPAPISAALRESAIAQGGNARALKEREILSLALANPEIVARHGEVLAQLPFADRSLDSLRHELLNVAASGFRLESGKLENHLVRAGMGTLMQRLKVRQVAVDTVGWSDPAGAGGGADAGEIEGRWLRATAQLREMVEADPERRRALARFKSEASEESWREAQRLLLSRVPPNE